MDACWYIFTLCIQLPSHNGLNIFKLFHASKWGYTFTQELVPKGTIKNLPIFTQELHYGNYLPTCICLFSHRNYKIVTGYQYQIVTGYQFLGIKEYCLLGTNLSSITLAESGIIILCNSLVASVHERIKPLKCNICGTDPNLELFEGRKPFKSKFTNDKCTMDTSLCKHKHVHTGENTIPIWRIVVIVKEGSLITY